MYIVMNALYTYNITKLIKKEIDTYVTFAWGKPCMYVHFHAVKLKY